MADGKRNRQAKENRVRSESARKRRGDVVDNVTRTCDEAANENTSQWASHMYPFSALVSFT